MSMLCKDIEDERGTIKNPHGIAHMFLEFALVTRREFIVENDDLRQRFLGQGFKFLNFA